MLEDALGDHEYRGLVIHYEDLAGAPPVRAEVFRGRFAQGRCGDIQRREIYAE